MPQEGWILAESLLNSLAQVLAEPSERGCIARSFLIFVLGGAGTYLMLPRGNLPGRRGARLIGAALATVSLILFVTMPIGGQGTGGMPRTIFWSLGGVSANALFYAQAFVSLTAALLMITSRNPVYSALWFALVLLANSGLYLLQGAEFVSAATVIIYAGAIIVTFLFVIMLAQPSGTAAYDRVSREPFLACVAGVLLASALAGTIHYSNTVEAHSDEANVVSSVRPSRDMVRQVVEAGPPSSRIQPTRPHVDSLGRTLFLEHYVSIEVAGVLLLAAVVGAMLIAAHRTETY